MIRDDAKKLVAKLAVLFPNQLTKELMRFIANEFLAFDVADAGAAITAHRATHDWISPPKLLEACRAAESARTRGEAERQRLVAGKMGYDGSIAAAQREGSFADVIRRQRPDLAGRSDFEVLLRYWWSQWHRYRAASDQRRGLMVAALKEKEVPSPTCATLIRQHDRQAVAARRKCVAGCRQSLAGAGMKLDVATRYARSIRSEAHHFKLVLEDVRNFGPESCSAAQESAEAAFV